MKSPLILTNSIMLLCLVKLQGNMDYTPKRISLLCRNSAMCSLKDLHGIIMTTCHDMLKRAARTNYISQRPTSVAVHRVFSIFS